jgi:NitT/TauT family transport system substrate-binding protein
VSMVYGVKGAVAPVLVAQEQGFFARHGLELQPTYVESGSQPTPTLLSGQVQIFYGTGEGVSAKLAGADVLYITSLTKPTAWQMFTTSDVTNFDSLRGKKIGSPGALGTSGRSSLLFLLAKHGLKPSDVTIVQTGNGTQGLAALQAHAVDATMLSASDAGTAKKLGLHALATARDEGWDFISGAGLVQRSYFTSHRNTLAQFLQAQVEGTAEYLKNPDVAKKVIGQYMKIDDPAVLTDTYNAYAGEFLRVPAVTEQSVQAALDGLVDTVPAAKTAKATDFYDNSLVSELQSSGFIDKAWAGVQAR